MNIAVTIKKLKQYKDFNLKTTDEIIMDQAADIVDMNISQMKDEGVKSSGESLGEYQPKTIEYKREKGQTTSHVTLRDTEDFHGAMGLTKENVGKFTVTSEDWKTGLLEYNWGQRNTSQPSLLFGLTPANEKRLTEEITKQLYEKLKRFWS